jgi:drug/metabolite transporter (DMT)-like permease
MKRSLAEQSLTAAPSVTEAPRPSAPPAAAPSDWLLLAGPGIIWGASFLFIAEGLRAIGPNGVTFVRILVGFAALALFPAARARVDRSAWRGIVLLAILWFAFPLSMFPFAEQHVSSALTGMLNGANPLFTAMVAAGFARRAPSRGIAAGLAVGLLGAMLVAWPTIHEGRSSVLGVLLILAALTSYAFALNLARPLQQRHGALPVIWRAQAVALVLTAPLGLPELTAAHWSLGPLLALLALGGLGTGIRAACGGDGPRGCDAGLGNHLPHPWHCARARRCGARRAGRPALCGGRRGVRRGRVAPASRPERNPRVGRRRRALPPIRLTAIDMQPRSRPPPAALAA